MIAWAIYAIAIAAALGLAALALERALELYGRATRWVWLGAMAGSLAFPAALMWIPRAAPAGAIEAAPAVAIGTPVVGPILDRLPDASASGWPDLAPWMAAAWAALSLALLVHFARSAWRLSRARRSWSTVEIDGVRVLESESLGPAVIGVFRPRIAVPAWVRELDEDLRALVLAHEQEHQDTSDPLLSWFGVACCTAVPWCAPLWWQLRRLRLAIEVDCDRRVLEGGASVARYGSLLLEVSRRSRPAAFPLVALFEPLSFLERRILTMTTPTPRHRTALAVAFALCAIPVVGLATALPTPTPLRTAEPPAVSDPLVEERRVSVAPVDTPPRFEQTPFDDRPRCVENCSSDAILVALDEVGVERGKGEMMCDAVVGIRIGEDGTVTDTDFLRSAAWCEPALVRWAKSTRWTPARRGGEPVAAWIAQPLKVVLAPKAEEVPDAERSARPDSAVPPASADQQAQTILRRAMVSQEMYHSARGEYADIFELDLEVPESMTLRIRGDAGEGYVMVARHDDGSTAYCANSEAKRLVEGSDC